MILFQELTLRDQIKIRSCEVRLQNISKERVFGMKNLLNQSATRTKDNDLSKGQTKWANNNDQKCYEEK